MSNQFEISWPRIIAEGMAIVVSILLAFWIQAWWEGQQRHAGEQEYLSTLDQTLTKFRAYYGGTMAFANDLRDSNRRLLDISQMPDTELTDRELDELLFRTTYYVPNYNVPDLESLLSSENIALVSNNDLRFRLGELRAEIDRLMVTIELQVKFQMEQLYPYMQRSTNLPQISHAVGQTPGNPASVYPGYRPKLGAAVSHLDLLGDQEFINILMRREWRITEIIDWRQSVRQQELDEKVAQIQQDIRQLIGR